MACTLTSLLLLLRGDTETNPGPSKWWQRRQADKQQICYKGKRSYQGKGCSVLTNHSRKLHPKLNMQPWYNASELLLGKTILPTWILKGLGPKQHMQPVCSQNGLLPYVCCKSTAKAGCYQSCVCSKSTAKTGCCQKCVCS